MKIALIGYGRMGREVERLMVGRGHEVVAVFDEDNLPTAGALRASGAELAIEFTTPEAVFDNIISCFEAGVAVVSGTTGWLDRWGEAVFRCESMGGTLFYASNYSIGVNLFFRLSAQLAGMMRDFEQYSVALSETHHIHKKDAPSGTALTLAGAIEQFGHAMPPIESIREGEVTGIHSVEWTSEVDKITLTHESLSRLGLAQGVVMAAEWVRGRTGIFSMDDLLR